MVVQDAVDSLRSKLNIPSEINNLPANNLVDLLKKTVKKTPDNLAFTSLGHSITFRQLDVLSDSFAHFLHTKTSLKKGDRIALMMANLVQYPIAFYGALKLGLIVVNTNPLYTERELIHQFNDSGAKALVFLSTCGKVVQKVIPRTSIKYVIKTDLADLHNIFSKFIINSVAKYVKKLVPNFYIEGQINFTDCIKDFPDGLEVQNSSSLDDIILLQYTGGTTGLSKGAILNQKNLLSNLSQMQSLFETFSGFEFSEKKDLGHTVILPLPLYHIYACTLSMLMISLGQHCVLIPNPRDLSSMIKAMKPWNFSVFCGLNTLFVSLCARDDFKRLDFSHLGLTISGGMALTSDAANRWEQVTGSQVHEGYGLTETSPVVSLNVGSKSGEGRKLGYIGVAAPSTELKITDADGNDLPCNEPGELCVRGPQVMQGYWNQDKKTEEVLDNNGWFATGDIALIDCDGFPKIVDRKKDMIIVSGFNVYPNEIEEVVSSHDGVMECAAIGVPDEKSGERVKIFVVKSSQDVTESDIIDFSRENLSAYKVPTVVEFISELPKSNVGKILRRELR